VVSLHCSADTANEAPVEHRTVGVDETDGLSYLTRAVDCWWTKKALAEALNPAGLQAQDWRIVH